MGRNVIVGTLSIIGVENNAQLGIQVPNSHLAKNAQPTLIITTAVLWAPATPPVWFVSVRNLLTENPPRNVLSGTPIHRTTLVRMAALTHSATVRDMYRQINAFAGIPNTFGHRRTAPRGIRGLSLSLGSFVPPM